MSADSHFADNVFLAQFQGALYDTSFTADTGQAITIGGNGYLDDAVKAYGTTSGYSNSAYFRSALAANLGNLTPDQVWTIDLLFYEEAGNNGHNLLTIGRADGTKPLMLYVAHSSGVAKVNFCPQGTDSGSGVDQYKIQNAYTYQPNGWRHLELGCDGNGNYYVFYEGQLLDVPVQDYIYHRNVTYGVMIGAVVNGSSVIANTYTHFQYVRVTPGVLRHTASFTPDKTAITAPVAVTGISQLGLEIHARNMGVSRLGLAVAVRASVVFGQSRLGLAIRSITSGVANGSAPITDPGTQAGIWGVRILLDGADISADTIGEVTVEAEEGAARLADFTWLPATGSTLSVAGLIGMPVVVTLIDLSSGSPASAMVLFTGTVERPQLNLETRTIRLTCTDQRQTVIGSISKDRLAELIGGYWSSVVFKKGTTSWGYALDRLSTVPACLDLSAEGFIRLTSWAAKAVADIEYDGDSILARPVISIAEASSMTNQVDIAFGYRYPRVKAEGYRVEYDLLAVGGMPFGYWVNAGHNFLVRASVEAAIKDAGGTLEDITYIALPTGAQPLPNGGFWLPNPNTDPLLCLGFTAIVSFDYAQTIDENYSITVLAEQSIATIGKINSTMSGALEGVYQDTTAVEINITLKKSDILSNPPTDQAAVVPDWTNAKAVTLSEETDRAAAQNAMETLIAIAKTDIWRAHRGHGISFEVPLNPAIDTDKTIAIDEGRVAAKGKVKKVRHVMSPDAGTAISEVDLAICSVIASGTNHADDNIVAEDGVADGTTEPLGAPTVVWNGLYGQDQVITITFPGVEAYERNKANVAISQTVAAGMVEDELTVSY